MLNLNSISLILESLRTCNNITGCYSLDYKRNGASITKGYKGVFFVYFLVNKGVIDYIGISESLYSRLIQHRCDKQFDTVLLLKFDTYKHMLEAEKELIDMFNPRLNTMCNFRVNRRKIKYKTNATFLT